MPRDAPGISDVDTQPFGDVVAAVNTRSWTDVLDRLEAEHDGRKIRWRLRMLDAAVAPDTVRRHYAAELENDGWTPISLPADFRGESWSYGWYAQASGDVFAVVGLTPKRAVAGLVPFNVLTTLPDAGR